LGTGFPIVPTFVPPGHCYGLRLPAHRGESPVNRICMGMH